MATPRSFLEQGSFCQPRHLACGEGPAHCLPRCSTKPQDSLIEDSRQTICRQTPMAVKQSVASGHWRPLFLWALSSLHRYAHTEFSSEKTRRELFS